MTKFPRARSEQLIIQELPDETLVFDLENNRAHCLNRTAASIWKLCDGQTPVREIAKLVSGELDLKLDERAVWFAVSQFNRDRLLERKMEVPAAVASAMNRRQMIRTLGVAAAVAIPLVTSIVAPPAAQAVSCLPTGATCSGSAECCSGVCNNSVCA